MRTYTELSQLVTFEERFNYLKLSGKVGFATFGPERNLNQMLYHDEVWKRVRREVILRDSGFRVGYGGRPQDYVMDLGLDGYPISGQIIVHHMNPITIEDIVNRNPKVFDPEYLICCSLKTHNDIHYGNISGNEKIWQPRQPGDTTIWRK